MPYYIQLPSGTSIEKSHLLDFLQFPKGTVFLNDNWQLLLTGDQKKETYEQALVWLEADAFIKGTLVECDALHWDQTCRTLTFQEYHTLPPETARYAQEKAIDILIDMNGQYGIFSGYHNGTHVLNLTIEELLPAMKNL